MNRIPFHQQTQLYPANSINWQLHKLTNDCYALDVESSKFSVIARFVDINIFSVYCNCYIHPDLFYSRLQLRINNQEQYPLKLINLIVNS